MAEQFFPAFIATKENKIRLGLAQESYKFKCICELNPEIKTRYYRRDISFCAKYNPARHRLILEEKIPLTNGTKILFSVYQDDYQGCTRDVTTNVVIIPCRHVDYKIYISEEVDNVIREFSGPKSMNYNVYANGISKRTVANIVLSNDCEDSSSFTHYELRLWVLISEPHGSGMISRFIFADGQ